MEKNNMKIMVAAALIALIAVSNASGTAQLPDKIIYEGKEYRLHSNPLEFYFEKHPKKRPKGATRTTALWRGYVATFEIKDKVMNLQDIKIPRRFKNKNGKYEYGLKSVKKEVFPGQGSLNIDWFTGILVLPYGRLIDYVHMGYASIYSNYILLEMENGKLMAEKKLTGEQYQIFRQKQFEAFKKTEEYKKRVADLKKKGNSPEFIDDFLRIYIIKYTSKFLDE
jgi:hypothetical protein